MKLTDLDPKWWAEEGREGQGLTFLCPCCREVRLCVALAQPLDGGEPFPIERIGRWSSAMYGTGHVAKGTTVVPPGYLWRHRGEGFGDLTLHPSVDASPAGHWHGWVTGGEAR